MDERQVRVEVFQLEAGGIRQIGSRRRPTESLAERQADLQAAIVQAVESITRGLDQVPAKPEWSVNTVEATFGVAFTAGAGVIISRAGLEATLEIKITVERQQ